MVLQFSYEEWREFREIVTGVEVPEEDMFVGDELLLLYNDEEFYSVWAAVFGNDGVQVGLDFYQRQCLLRFDVEDWERFREVVDRVGDSCLRRIQGKYEA